MGQFTSTPSWCSALTIVEVNAMSGDQDCQKIPAVAPMCLENNLNMQTLKNNRANPADVIVEQPMSLDNEVTVAIIQGHPTVRKSTNISSV